MTLINYFEIFVISDKSFDCRKTQETLTRLD